MDNITTNFGDVFLWTLWFFIVIGALVVWVLVVVDVFSHSEMSGWAKALWLVVLIFLPIVGVLVYLVVRGVSTHKLAQSYRNS
jgi:FtsH-binding integral membrane protein